MRILMVEDDKKLCEAVCWRLEREGFAVDVCSDGDDGLRWIRQQAHDVILLDRMLPTLSGTTVLERMRADGISTPVLVVTALDTVANRVEGLEAGADDYLVKPFAMEELIARIRAMGRRPRRWESAARGSSWARCCMTARSGFSPAPRGHAPCPIGRGTFWRCCSATRARPCPEGCCSPGCGGRMRRWRTEIWTTMSISSAAGSARWAEGWS